MLVHNIGQVLGSLTVDMASLSSSKQRQG